MIWMILSYWAVAQVFFVLGCAWHAWAYEDRVS